MVEYGNMLNAQCLYNSVLAEHGAYWLGLERLTGWKIIFAHVPLVHFATDVVNLSVFPLSVWVLWILVMTACVLIGVFWSVLPLCLVMSVWCHFH